MRHMIPLAILGAGSAVGAALLTPTPDAITMLYTLVCLLALASLGYWLGRRSARADAGGTRGPG